MYYPYVKRILDLIVSFIAILLLLPLFLIVVIVLYFVNKGYGVFFLHERVGENNKIFSVIKFKTMIDKFDSNGFALPNKERLTPIGSFLRKTSIDEIPQLFNVLKGNMSLIGPRPLPIRYLELYNTEQIKRHNIRPGITGWAQVNGRNSIPWSKKFELDIWYVQNISFRIDFKIFFLTILRIIKKSDINSSTMTTGGKGFDGTN
jgi:lipopolysaccharide/colanic/teichoic acid biosynthesis glycosyltransferase